MFDYFVFPVNFNDIQQESHALDRHKVVLTDLAIPDRQIVKMLKSIDSHFNQNYQSVCEPENFDYLYSLIKCFGENIESKSIQILQELSSTIQYITENILSNLQNLNEQSNVGKLRLSFKMTIFLCLYFISATTMKKQKAAQGDIIADAINKQKGKKKIKNQSFELTRHIVQNQKNCINLIKESLKINFTILWQRKEIDTQFFKKYTDVCIKILESNLVKDQQISNCIFQILETILRSNYCQSIQSTFQTVLANLVYQGDVIDNLVQFFAKAEGPQLQKLCTQSLTLVVVYLVNKTNLNSQSQSIKNTKQFLSKLSEKIPKIFYTNLSCFIILFRHQSYYLRNAIADIMMNILKYVMNGQESDEIYSEARQKFISTLLQRIYDKSSFCRCHVLGILGQLASEKLVPRKYMILFLKAGMDRVKDQSINTRKKALQLINVVIDQICAKQISLISEIERQIQITELQLRTLHQEQQRLKGEIDQVEDEDKLEQLVTDVKLVKKRIKATQQKQMSLLQVKQINNLMNKVIDNVRILLGSKTQTDVLQTIKLFIKLHKLNFERAKSSLPDIRILIFSKEKRIKDEVLTNFVYLHLQSKSEDIAKQLIELFTKATPQDLSALQEIMQTIISQALSKNIVIIKPQVFAHMWNQFIAYERNQTNIEQKRSIMTILRIAFSKDASLIKSQNLQSFLNILKSYVQSNEPDFHIVKQISKIICLDDQNINQMAKNFLIAQIYILVNTQGSTNNEWFSACENILTCIFKICESPEKLSELFIKKLHQKLQKDKSVKSLCHFIFTLSHNCLKCLIYLDSIQNKIKGMKQKQMMEQSNNVQQELDKVMGGAEAQLERKMEEIQNLSQKIIQDPFINRWICIIQKIVINFKSGTELQIICVLAYCKFLCLSSVFCEQKFPHIIKVLNNPNVTSVVKNNIIIAMGDLLHRFPNIIEPYNKNLYQNLHDKDSKVRKTTLTVITHLSLNDMIKVKSDMCDVALLFQDKDPQIESLVKQFFHQMNKKDPKILFNMIPDALSRFSNVQKIGNQSTFRIFLENILPLLEKDKYSQSLVIKLCERLANSLNLLQIANTSHCLSELNINEKALRRIIENFQSFRKKLQTPQVHASFKNLITKLKKIQKTDLKALIQELQEKINHSGEQLFNLEEIKRRNLEKLNRKQPKKRTNNTLGQGTIRKSKKKRDIQEEEDDDYDMDIEPSPAPKNARPQRQGRKMKIIQQSDQVNEQEDDEEYAN